MKLSRTESYVYDHINNQGTAIVAHDLGLSKEQVHRAFGRAKSKLTRIAMIRNLEQITRKAQPI